MGLLIAGIVLLIAGGVCVYLAGVSASAAAAVVSGVYILAAAIRAVVKKEKPE